MEFQCYLLNKVIRSFLYVALGVSSDDASVFTGEITTGAGLSALTLTKATFEGLITTTGVYGICL